MPDEPDLQAETTEFDQILGPAEAEPDVVAETPTAETGAAPRDEAAPGPSVDERLGRALATIESLQGQVRDLNQRAMAPREEPRVQTPQDFIEVLGTRIARDPASRPIQLTANDLLQLGWNEDPASAINILANAFFDYVGRTIPPVVMTQLADRTTAHNAVQARQGDFWTEYPDLKEHADLCQMYDLRAWNSGLGHGRGQRDYNAVVANHARAAIARMRGQTLEQYTATLRTASNGAQSAPRTRQVTGASPPGRSARQTGLTDQEKEMLDLMG